MSSQVMAPIPGATSLEQYVEQSRLWESVLTDYGVPRLKVAREYFRGLTQDDIPFLMDVFTYWQTYNEYMVLRGTNQLKDEKPVYVAVKCSKRGNDVFGRRLDRKLGFLGQYSNVRFFKASDFGKRKKRVKTRLLWVTLTYDSKRCSLSDAWENCMDEYNLWITNLRNKYGQIEVMRFIQAFPGDRGKAFGYPHFHMVLLFKDYDFSVFPNIEKNREGELGLVYRIEEKDSFHSQGNWHSFTDVKALSSMKGVVNYCRKYAQGVAYGDSEEARLNCAMAWLFRKQTYSLSKGFRKALSEFIGRMQVSKAVVQKTLVGDDIPEWKWEFFGIFDVYSVEIDDPGVWVKGLDAEKFHELVDSRCRHGG